MNLTDVDRVKASRPPVLALDIGGTWTRGAVVAASGRILASARERTLSWGSGREFISQCHRLLSDVWRAAGDGGGEPAAVGISVTGPVDVGAGRLFRPPNTGPALDGLDLRDPLAELIALPVFVEKDTNAAARAEQRYGGARGARSFVYVTVSTGVGAAIVLDDVLLRGVDGVAGELGHVCVDPLGPLCGCGRHGCLEAIASGPAIASAAAEQLAYLAPPVEGHHVAAAAEAGDLAAQAVLSRARAALVSVVVDVVNLVNPEIVVLGGSVITGNQEWVRQAGEAIHHQALQPAGVRASVCLAELGDDGGLLGAALLATAGPAADPLTKTGP